MPQPDTTPADPSRLRRDHPRHRCRPPRQADTARPRPSTLARAALLEDVGAADVGDHLGAVAEGERVVSHQFACTRPGYVGWRWSVTVARAPRQKTVTVDEIVLLPGDDAIVAPGLGALPRADPGRRPVAR